MSCQDHAMLLSCYAEIALRSFHGQEPPQDDTGEMRRDRLQLWNRRDETGPPSAMAKTFWTGWNRRDGTGPLLDAQWTLNGRSMDVQWTFGFYCMSVRRN